MKKSKLSLLVLVLASSASLRLQASDFKHITIDGSFDDWAGVAPAYEDLSFQDDPLFQSDPTSFDGVTDFKTVYVAHDDQYLYVRFTLYAPGNPFTAQNNIFIDADGNPGTGFRAAGLIGSEMLIQSGTGYQEKNGSFVDDVNPNSIGGLDWAAAPSGVSTNFEFRISRKATFDSDSTPVFTSDLIEFILEAENSHFATRDTAPDDHGIQYTFTPAPSAASGNSSLISLTGTSWSVNTSGNDLGTAWRAIDYDDTQSGWTTGNGLFGFTTNATAYPVAIQTPVTAVKTFYLRTRFEWTNDPASVILVSSNFLSDGAVVYLNGAEVKRIRMPSGDIAFNTSATGSPAVAGQPELAGIATGPLVIGTNVLAVEVHQTGTDTSDLVFGLSLLAATQFPVTITAPSQPVDRSVGAGDPTLFSAQFIGTEPLSFQWLKDNNPIPDATNATFTIDTVLQGDAGGYALRIANALATNVTRTAILTVTNSPARITDATQPADQTVTEGLSATFSVTAVGSAPLGYQWFKNSSAITDATNTTFTIPDVASSDAGDYYVVVTNPFPSTVQSRTAHLTVSLDTNSPTILNALGTPNTVTISFSEPVTSASATAVTNYSLSGGLTVTGATQNPTDPTIVTLTTSPQTLGTSYTLTVNKVFDRFNNSIAANSQVTFASRIVIDGSFDDWASVPLAFTDAQDSTESIDYKDVYVAADDQYVYMRVSLYSAGDPADFHNNLFIDADNNPATGFTVGGVGSEMLIQSGAGYQEKGGGFNEGDINGLDYAIAPTGNATDFEFRFSRNATYASSGLPVFTTNALTFVLEAESSGFATKDLAPDSGGYLFTIAGSTPATSLVISRTQDQVSISWSGTARLQTRASLTSGNWQDIANAPNPYVIQITNSVGFYRLAQ